MEILDFCGGKKYETDCGCRNFPQMGMFFHVRECAAIAPKWDSERSAFTQRRRFNYLTRISFLRS